MGKKSSKTTTKNVYGNTTTLNPYFTSKTTNKGTVTDFVPGTAYDTVNNFVNSNIRNVLEEYLNPTLNSTTNRAKMNAFTNTLSNNTAKAVENDIVNPLSNRNMIRSSQATNMYNGLANNVNNSIADYANKLLVESQKNSGDMLTTLLYAYLNGYNALSDTQKQSLSASQGNSTRTQNTTNSSGMDISNILNLATQAAMTAAKLAV